jgi:exodeoxyribonuclease VII large subunit
MTILGRARTSEPGPAGSRPWSVAELNRCVQGLLETSLPRVWVEGAMSRPVVAASGHLYFGLQDETPARVDAVMWAARVRLLRFKPAEGVQVRARGIVTVYPPSGKYQLVLDELEPAGEGAREAKLRALREKLAAEGLFAPERKRPIPFLPRCVALVTSPTGAAVRDLLRVIYRRFPRARTLLVPVRVQGEGAAEEVAEGVRRASRVPEVETIVVGRGGGSVEDLWSFNEECVARAVFGARVPVVSAVGHEIDTTLCDQVADLRAATPSEAAERVVPVLDDLLARLDEDRRRLRSGVVRAAKSARADVEAAARRRGFASFGRIVDEERQRLDELDLGLRDALRARLDAAADRLSVAGRLLSANRPEALLLAARARAADSARRLARVLPPRLLAARQSVDSAGRALGALDPTAVLSRGFSLTWAETPEGRRLLRGADELRAGETLRTTFGRGADLRSDPRDTAPSVVARDA